VGGEEKGAEEIAGKKKPSGKTNRKGVTEEEKPK